MTSFDSGSFVMKLFIATPSPFARKARVTLLEKQIPHEIIVDNPWQPGSQVKGINPLAKIPTLVFDDGLVALGFSKSILAQSTGGQNSGGRTRA